MNRFLIKHLRLGAVGLTCAALGAWASAIATAGAATPTHATHAPAHRAGRLGGRWLLRHTVHADLVVATKKGFVNVTVDRGSVQSISGSTLTLVEGGPKTAQRTETLTLPATARVRNNRHRTTLAQLSKGERALVIQGPHRSLVVAHTTKRR